ncbi:AraC family transcriptional regulator [Acidovorax sp. Leaf84]|uniref:helix-turn-helix transcriptional regulator n=1 Tax=Acidovorax sp. Leaf84 TaxID=1736240 RepID=UPI0006F6F049|nr:AraC family transcriptional regulator [Acidovorax sp. Leaf84]KQO29087.1 AraC family transcriptional regulator [Acidovorax sp. Leaf84]
MPDHPLFVDATALQDLQVALLSRRPYSASDPVRTHSVGMALERQRGVHAIGSDRREDFDTWPGTLAYTPPGVDVFSESATGGEYLVVRWSGGGMEPARHLGGTQRRVHWMGHAQALAAARHLRRLALAPAPDALAIEQAAWGFVGWAGLSETASHATHADRPLRPLYARVLDRIASDYAQPLTIAQLALAEGKSPLRFLREFTRLVGMTPHAFIVETRVQAARALLRRGTEPLASIALDCGFTHQSHMGTAFRKVLGQTPGQYAAASKATAVRG